MTRPDWLTAAARRSEDEEWTLGFLFKRYRQFKNKTHEALAEELSCSLETLDWLALCRVPDEGRFVAELEIIASRFDVNPNRLALVLRLGREGEGMSRDDDDCPEGRDDGPEVEPGFIRDGDFQSGFGVSLAAVLEPLAWDPANDNQVLAAELKTQVARSVDKEERVRALLREKLLPSLASAERAPRGAGFFSCEFPLLESIRERLLYPGRVEAVNSTVLTHDSLPVSITQIGIAVVSYNATAGVFAQRLYRREMSAQTDGLQEALDFIANRQRRLDVGRRDELSMLARRGIRAYAERSVLLKYAKADWRVGHGHPFASELLSGSGYTSLRTRSLELMRELLEQHPRFVFVSDVFSDLGLLTLGNALNAGEYILLDTVEADCERVVNRWNYEDPGQKAALQFVQDCGPRVFRGLFRASNTAPPYVFYAHRAHAHEAAHVAIADSILRSERGFPLLLDVAEQSCKVAFGTEGFMSLVRDAYTHAGRTQTISIHTGSAARRSLAVRVAVDPAPVMRQLVD